MYIVTAIFNAVTRDVTNTIYQESKPCGNADNSPKRQITEVGIS